MILCTIAISIMFKKSNQPHQTRNITKGGNKSFLCKALKSQYVSSHTTEQLNSELCILARGKWSSTLLLLLLCPYRGIH